MTALLALGANLGGRRATLERALLALAALPDTRLVRVSSAYETTAVLPEGAPADWDRPYLNLAAELDTALAPLDLLDATQAIERTLGRTAAPRWAPRPIDIDLIACGDARVVTERLTLPHPRAVERAFVLAPLAEIAPLRRLPGDDRTILERKRALPAVLPAWMAVINLTPDSFSDGGAWAAVTDAALDDVLEGVNCVDLGAESTRPGAAPLDPDAEWQRLEGPLVRVLERLAGRRVRPLVSVDTRNARTAERALALGVDVINDVSGLEDPHLVECCARAGCGVVLMHNVGVPADRSRVLPAGDPVTIVRDWLVTRLDEVVRAGIDPTRVLLDPGIGFGKTPAQSLALLDGIHRFLDLPARLLVGHSRKSFLEPFGRVPPSERDPETLAVSGRLAERGVDMLRVHAVGEHRRFWRVYDRLRRGP